MMTTSSSSSSASAMITLSLLFSMAFAFHANPRLGGIQAPLAPLAPRTLGRFGRLEEVKPVHRSNESNGANGASKKAQEDTSDTADTTSSSRKRRKRKDGQRFVPPTTDAPSTPTEDTTDTTDATDATDATPSKKAVVMQVQDIRDVLSGKEETTMETTDTMDMIEKMEDTIGEDARQTPQPEPSRQPMMESSSNSGSRTVDESMEQLLADARSFRSDNSELSPNNSAPSTSTSSDDKSISEQIFDLISTILTIDFFLVLALLAWFLAGIFCSAVLKDDAVQIAFNMNFERVVQPALGVLMIGSVAGAVLGKKEEEE